MMESFPVHGNSLFKALKESTQFYPCPSIYLSIYRKTGIKIANRILKQYTRTSNYENVCTFVDDDYLGDKTWN